MTELEALGARIASCRGSRSQKDLALETGLDVSTISRIERGITDPTYGTLSKIREALNVPWEALVLDAPISDLEGDRPGEQFLRRRMSPAQASRLAGLVRDELRHMGRESFEANVREFAEIMGGAAWAGTIATLALAESRWIPKAALLDRIATCLGIDRELALPMLRLETENGPFDAVLAAWERVATRPRALYAPHATSDSTEQSPGEKVPLTDAEVRALRSIASQRGGRTMEQAIREDLRRELDPLNKRFEEAMQIVSERLPPAEAKQLRQKVRPLSKRRANDGY